MDDPTAVSLFSGIGGLDEGLRRAGFQHVLMCESDPWRRDVLRARFPGVPVHEDVRTLDETAWADRLGSERRALGGEWYTSDADTGRDDAERARRAVPVADDVRDVGDPPGRAPRGTREDAVAGCGGAGATAESVAVDLETGRELHANGWQPAVDLLCGGFPCQDLSVAGNRAGLNGARSGLFFEFARIADALRPRWVLVENVPGLLSSNGGRDFGIVLGTLADIGYGLAWRVLDSRFFGVPQRRRRVFVVGARADGDPAAAAGRASEVLTVGSRCPRHPATRGEARADVAGTLGGGPGSRGWAQDTERMTFVADTLLKNESIGDDPTTTNLIAYAPNGKAGNRDDGGIGPEETLIAAPLEGSDGHHGYSSPRGDGADNLVAYALNGKRGNRDDGESETFVTAFHTTQDPIHHHQPALGQEGAGVAQGATVRRLTPVECMRLQGFPDDWFDGVPGTSDSKMYAGLGDAVTVPVAEWIGRRMIAQ